MAKKEETKEAKVRNGDITVVAQDTNWRTYVSKEIGAENDFAENWGFMTVAAQSKKFALIEVRW
jgi:hypothetical protein